MIEQFISGFTEQTEPLAIVQTPSLGSPESFACDGAQSQRFFSRSPA